MFADYVDQTIALVVFTLISSMTPGPNNLMLLASGVNFGFRRTIPHIAGVVVGFPAMTALVALGLGGMFRAAPWLHDAIEVVGVAYLLWLAAKIAFQPVSRGVEVRTKGAAAKPFGFFQAAAFQWVNAKGWVTAISAVSVYVPDGFGAIGGAAFLVAVFLPISIASTCAWTGLGASIAHLLHEPTRLRLFNLTMAASLVASLWPAFVDLARLAREITS
ncbi:MAG: LysE family translocator [Hyphomicrobiales bacterium]|nr:LysE family translocator [Hyphomicrobiales bacterium]